MTFEMDDVFSFANILLEDCVIEQVNDDLSAEVSHPDLISFEPTYEPSDSIGDEDDNEEDYRDEAHHLVPITIVSLDPTSFVDAKAKEIMLKNEKRMEHILCMHHKKKRAKQIIVPTTTPKPFKEAPVSKRKSETKKIYETSTRLLRQKKAKCVSKGTHQLHYIEPSCFECNEKCADEEELIAHWKSSHFESEPNGKCIQCPQCDCKYMLTAERFRRLTEVQSYISFYFNHRVKKHDFQVPPFIKVFQCAHPHCQFVAYSEYLIMRHIEGGRHCVRLFKTPGSKPIRDQLAQYGSGNKYSLIFKQFKCFVCDDEVEYNSREKLIKHWREKHIFHQKTEGVMACASCDLYYQIPPSRLSKITHILTCMAYYFSHCVKKHNLPVPKYIVKLKCSRPGCGFVAFTKQLLQRHLQEVKHVMKAETTSSAFVFKEYRCFLCLKDNGEDLGPFEDAHTFANHWRSNHVTFDGDHSVTLCADCPEMFHIGVTATDKDIISSVSQLCFHRSETHSVQRPSYVNAIKRVSSSKLKFPSRRIDTESKEDKERNTPMSLLTFLQLKCFECNDDVLFANSEALTEHWRQNHFTLSNTQASLKCKHCEYSIGLNISLLHKNHDIGRCVASYLSHSIRKHSTPCPPYIQELECSEAGCKFRALTMKLLQSHVRHTMHHKLKKTVEKSRDPASELSLKELRCFLCDDGLVFANIAEYEDHFQTVHSVIQDEKSVLFCRQCDAPFPSIISLFKHMVKQHLFSVPWYVEEFKCQDAGCVFVAYSSCGLQKHLKAQKHSTTTDVYQSYLNFHEYRCFLCAEPSELFDNKKMFEQHLNTVHVIVSLDEPSFVCSQCQHVFKLHLSNGADFGKALPTKKYDPSRSLCVLLNHMVTKHDFAIPLFVVSFKCDHPGCSFTTVRKYTFDRHVKSHIFDKQCYQCGLFFSATRIDKHVQKCSSLPVDKGLNDTTTAFTCFECGISFPRKAALNKHLIEAHSMRNLAENKKDPDTVYQCDVCAKVLTERRSIKRHMQGMHPTTPSKFNKILLNSESDETTKLYECNLCSAQMSLLRNVKQHFLQQHGLQYEAHHSHLVREAPLQVFDCEIADFSNPFDPSLLAAGSADNNRLSFPAPDSISDVLDCSMRLSGVAPHDMMSQNCASDMLMKNVPILSPLRVALPRGVEEEMTDRNDHPWMDFTKT